MQPRCSERASRKARWVLAQAPGPFDPAEACRALVGAVETRLQQWPLAPERSVERVEPTYGDSDVLIAGYYGTTMRLFALVTINSNQRSAEILVSLTKGDLSVDSPAFGDRGPLVGNSIVRAMLLEVGICELRRQGVGALTARPMSEYLRRHYAMMGFVNGEMLDLCDEQSLSKAFDVVDQVYSSFGFGLVDEA